MTIRHAAPADGEAVARLTVRAIQDIAAQLTGEREEQAILQQLQRFYEEPGNRFSADRYLVKTVDDRVAGMILCYPGRDAEALYRPVARHLDKLLGEAAPRIDVETDTGEFYIDAFAVFAEYGGRGYGQELIAAAERWAIELGERRIALNVDKTNERAHSLYQRLGFREDKEMTINGHAFRHMIKPL